MVVARTACIADDDPATRELMVRVLALFGFEVTSFDDGIPLANAVIARAPDLIVTDQHMTHCNGTAALGRIRMAGAICPAVLLTAFPAEELTVEARGLMPVTVLSKPLDLAALRNALEALGCLR